MSTHLHEGRTAPDGFEWHRSGPQPHRDAPAVPAAQAAHAAQVAQVAQAAQAEDVARAAQVARQAMLRQVRLFAGLAPHELAAIDRRLVPQCWAAGAPLYGADDPAQHLFVLTAGEVRLSRTESGGATVATGDVLPGRIFGAISSRGGRTYGETAEAVLPSRALRMDLAAFRTTLREHPDIALLVLDDIAERLARSRAGAVHRATDTVTQRVASCLLRLADTEGQPRAGVGTLVQGPLSRTDLAELAGTSPEAVDRVLARLRTDGIIESTRRWTAVLDRRRLEAIAQDREVPVAQLRVRPADGPFPPPRRPEQ